LGDSIITAKECQQYQNEKKLLLNVAYLSIFLGFVTGDQGIAAPG
jgi:hypothetical protein